HHWSWREAIIWCLENVYPRSRTLPDPEPSPPSPCCVEPKPEPTAGSEPMPTVTNEPGARASRIICPGVELATALATREITIDSENAHCTMAEGELRSVDYVYTVLPPSSSACPE
ncbi:hypothetical protein M9458_003972, partial [Cirrhinus mrigala]